MNRYRAVLFDMDGVIVDSMRHHAESWQSVFKKYYDLDLPLESIYKREGMSGIASIADILIEQGVAVPDKSDMVELREKKLELFEQKRVEVFPVVEDILEFLHSRSVRMGLVTGSLMRSVRHLLSDAILSYFEVIVTVDDISNGKPHPEPYLRGVSEMNGNKENTLAIENAPMGIISAVKAGLECFAIETTLPKSYLKGADRVFADHNELYLYLKDNIQH